MPFVAARRTFAQALKPIITAVIGLNKNRIAHVLHPIADLTLDATSEISAHAIIVCPRTIAVERVAVAIGLCSRKPALESRSYASVLSSFIPPPVLRWLHF